jgi:hypothetical protein
MLMMFILGMAALAYIVKSMNVASMRTEQDVKTMVALGEAKGALIAWSVAHKNWPGIMPFPDRLETTSPNYDGKSDCVTNGLNNSHLIGKLPLFGDAPCVSPQDGLGVKAVDSSGERFWYAVSKNLIRTSGSNSTPIINPSIIDTKPWLRVFDANGNLISNRVAVVIIAPGQPLAGQNRSGATPPVGAFLDEIVIGGATYSNRDYDQDNEDFIMGGTTKPTFNDRLVYITIDELTYALEKRASQEAGQKLRDYYLASNVDPANRSYPYAADVNNACVENANFGFLPIQPSMATCTSAQACTLSFPMTQVKFTLDMAENYDAKSGACTYAGNACTCWGVGSCTGSSITFSCTVGGSCTSTSSGHFTFTYTSKLSSNTDANGSCLGGNGTVTCTGAGTFVSPVTNCTSTKKWIENLPLWFLANRWQDYIYYTRSPTSSLESGGRTGVSALLVSAGAPIVDAPFSFKGSPQSRPSNNIADYLDSAENTDGDSVFDATNKQKTHIYNDQVFIVAP